MKKLSFLLLLILAFYRLFPENPPIIPKKPRLIVEIIIEGLDKELLQRYWDKFSENGIKKIIKGGTFYPNASYNYTFINNASGYAIISTGTYPSYNGIIGKKWYDRLEKKQINAVSDPNYKIIGINYNKTGVSPLKILNNAWSDYLMLANYKQSKVISIALDDYAAVISAGQRPTAAYWFDTYSGNWISSSYYCDTLKQWVKNFNLKHIPDIYLNQIWQTTYPINEYTESLPDENSFEQGINGQIAFPYNINELNAKNSDYNILKYTPFANTLTKDFALNAITYENLGKDKYTDVIIISFEATHYIAEKFGIRSVELEDAYIKLDKDIAHLLQQLEKNIGTGRFLLLLTSTKGSCDYPIWLNDIGYKVSYFNKMRLMVVLNSYLRSIYGLKNWVEYVSGNSIYLNTMEIDKQKINYSIIETQIAQFLVQLNAIDYATPSLFAYGNIPDDYFFKKILNSYCPKRSGEIMFILKPNVWIKENNTIPLSDCHSCWEYNATVPLVFYGWKSKPKYISEKVDMTNLAYTLASIMNIDLPITNNAKLLLKIDKFY